MGVNLNSSRSLFYMEDSGFMTDYKLLAAQIRSLAEDEPHYIPVMSNASALLNENMEDLNWAGFYIMNKGSLMLGPFQGKVACIRIELGKGVCGTAALRDETQLVKDVHQFPGHIACDSASNSEIVVPIHRDGKVVAVLDIDSPSLSRFDEQDKAGLEEFVKALEEITDFSDIQE
ncbi:GAF domain-containing protein [Butyrivibrio sp. AE2032]|uniref:GAF domain-containing protein n=1 Tax=Butyrivibrio sp. AE2032 TaxID=1458463 RepID=UPI002E8E5516|nr:GAF domain-containing protein [Butyrivibrio sp. AE2032]